MVTRLYDCPVFIALAELKNKWEREACISDKSEKHKATNPTAQAGSRVTEGQEEVFHFFSLPRIRSILADA